ncbi:Uridine kinase [bioreactor metagenome]|uniref:Uridine kinase n=1 Tax=bioreactor metagenome TaxID=1076179 RepID=A0A645CMP5_9ZZZZ|nr:nucleoside kinase [Oscillospiraceae bacterium]
MYEIKNEFIKKAQNSEICAYVSECEANFEKRLIPIADSFIEKNPVLAALAGPSCSGKTTGANKLYEMLRQRGKRIKVLSTDDFFKNQAEAPLNPDGTKNYDSFSHIDSDYLVEVLYDISRKRKVFLPVFDFLTGTRKPEYVEYDPEDHDIVIIEGIHALNDKIIGNIDPDKLLGIYISVADSYFLNGEELFSCREIRLLRRLVRDSYFRNANAERTFALWKGVTEAEKQYITPFIKNADIRISSAFEYEPCVMRNHALDVLGNVAPDSKYKTDADLLSSKISEVAPIDDCLIPPNSLLHEFLG